MPLAVVSKLPYVIIPNCVCTYILGPHIVIIAWVKWGQFKANLAGTGNVNLSEEKASDEFADVNIGPLETEETNWRFFPTVVVLEQAHYGIIFIFIYLEDSHPEIARCTCHF